MTSVEKNIPKFYLFQACWMFVLMFTIDIVFEQAIGLSATEITILSVIWAVTAFLFEVPSGALADKWSRKYTLALSGVFAAVGLFIYGVSNSFLPLAFAIIFMALRNVCASGTGNALIYDSLKAIGREQEFEKILGRIKLIGVASVSVAGVLGGLLATNNIRLPFLLSIVGSLLASLVALTFTEPPRMSPSEEVNYFKHIRSSLYYLLQHPLVRFLILYLILMDIAISCLDEYDQLYLTFIGFPLAYFGLWIGARRVMGGIGSFFGEKLKNLNFETIKIAALGAMVVALLTIGFGNWWMGLAVFPLIFFIWGMVEVLVSGEFHRNVESSQRATAESLMVFLAVIIDIPIRLGFGMVTDAYDIRFAYVFIAAILIAYVLFLVFMKSSRRRIVAS